MEFYCFVIWLAHRWSWCLVKLFWLWDKYGKMLLFYQTRGKMVKPEAKVATSFKVLIEKLDELCLRILNLPNDYPLWVSNNEFTEGGRNLDKLIFSLKNIYPARGKSPQETYHCPGAIGVNEVVLALIQKVNEAKDAFKDAVNVFRAVKPVATDKWVRALLADEGYPAISLKQVYRYIHFLNCHPRRIAWVRGRNGSNVIITKKQAESLLREVGEGEHIDIQLAKLSLLSDKEKLVIHHPIKPCWHANIAKFQEEEEPHYLDIRTSLPIFYHYNPLYSEPVVCFSRKSTRNLQKPRADKRLEEGPFLGSIHAYRYKST